MTESTSYEIITSYMIPEIRTAMSAVAVTGRSATEIRLRSGRAVTYIFPDRIKFLTRNGKLTGDYDNPENIAITAEDIRQTVDKLCHYSVHSCSRELREGYFVLKGGIRVGVAGTYSETAGKTISSFNALNFRIARCVKGCAERIAEQIYGKSVLICGGVNTGKTTVLRDLCRIYGNRIKISLIDERNEIASVTDGVPENDVGVLTDILVGCGRAEGIISAVRTLSPDMIFCDEISTPEDVSAISGAYGCGVGFTATVHAENYENLLKRRTIRPLLENGIFEYAVFLEKTGRIREIRRLGRCFSG
ncbi:MAG: Flp pilus assembly complex ATPase component TadA [Ruminococcus sp.]|nr:Flp pilus assembly complex ATPase component TadA [Ruminococcus sp.]